MDDNTTIMFVDMIGSTRLKYRMSEGKDGDKAFLALLQEFIGRLRKVSQDRFKFTGDGGMLAFSRETGGAAEALRVAEITVQALDRANADCEYPPVHVRIGIATGPVTEISPHGGLSQLDLVG